MTITNREKLIMLGEALHGPLWQNAIARDLQVNSRQVHRWVSGQYEPRDRIIAELVEMARAQGNRIAAAIKLATT